MNTLDKPITIQRKRKLEYVLPVKTRYETTENIKNSESYCPNHKDKICILSRLKRMKISADLMSSLNSETDDELSSCSNSPERPTPEELEMDKPVLTEIEQLRGKITDEQLAIKEVLDRNQDVFSRVL